LLDDLLEFRRHEDDRKAAFGKSSYRLIDLGFCADVDASRWLVEEEDTGPPVQPLAYHQLLLIAAGEGADRLVQPPGLEPEGRGGRSGEVAASRRRDHAGRADLPEIGERDVASSRQQRNEPLGLPVLGDEDDAARDGRPRALQQGARHTIDLGVGAGRPIRPREPKKNLRSPRTDETGDPENLALADSMSVPTQN
jgi:hypothetical protein